MIDNNLLFFGHKITSKDNLNLYPSSSLVYNEKIITDKKITTCKILWEQIIEEKLSKNEGRIVIPLSGGLDSRLILAGLLTHISPKEIITYTFGPEKSFDFIIGNLIAKKIGTIHYAHAIKFSEYTHENEIKWANILKKQISLFYRPPMKIVDEFKNDNLWIGFMGDPLAGSHFNPKINKLDDAINLFLSKYGLLTRKKACQYGVDVDVIINSLKDSTDFSQKINFFENIDFSIRQSQYILPHIAYSNKSTLPFIDKRWVNTMLTLPASSRINEKFYRDFMLSSYTKLFSYPCKNNHGYSIESKWSVLQKLKNKFYKNKSLYLNYIDFNQMLRGDNSFSRFIKKLIFQQHDIDPNIVWQDFLNNEIKYEFVLNLASIQINNDLIINNE